MPKDKTQPEIIKQANYHYEPGRFGIIRTLPGQKLMDLEEWLNTYLLIERPSTSTSIHKAKQRTEKRIREIIADAANTLGIAHYDDSVPLTLDKLREFKVGEADLLVRFLAETSSLIISVGNYVIQKASEAD